MYNVARYLPEFFESLERQSYGFDRIQVILVDDGSTDGGETLRFAKAFAEEFPDNVTLLSKPNGGQASARNFGIPYATGTWLTFPDPDDVLNDDYFSQVDRALAAHEGAAVCAVSTRLLLWYEDAGELKDTHALAKRFHYGELVRSLESDPDWVQPHVTSGLVRRDIAVRAGLRFPEELRLRFEDGRFISEYFLNFDDPRVLFVPGAHYHYRQRADNSSTVQSTKADPRKYVDTIDIGFRPLIEMSIEKYGRVPTWLQTLFLYDQFWILRASQGGETRRARFPESMYSQLGELLPFFLDFVDERVIEGFSLMPVAPWMREALLLIKRGGGHGPLFVGGHDGRRGLRAYLYRYYRELPDESIEVGGQKAEPRFEKVQGLEYAGRPLIWQRTIWLPDDVDVAVSLDGVPVSLAPRPARFVSAYALNQARRSESLSYRLVDDPSDVQQLSTSPAPRRHLFENVITSLESGASRALRSLSRKTRRIRAAVKRRVTRGGWKYISRDFATHSPFTRGKYKDAWIFIDRDVDANDSAEDLYFWIRENQPSLNSWFVVRKNAPDWHRLKSLGARLIPYGGAAFFAALSQAKHLASSHADRFITDVLPKRLRGRYIFTFLQHGIIKGDISSWLNGKLIHVFVTSTEDEYDYIVGPSPYRFGAKEVRLTGLPRHDVLLERASRVVSAERKKLLIMPTWRDYLVSGMLKNSGERARVEWFESTSFFENWSSLLASQRLENLAKENNLDVIFMPHPNMKSYLDSFKVPAYVHIYSYEDVDVRQQIIEACCLVTDYSSMAFNAAYLNLPTVYFQFDAEEYFSGHTEREGYFRYDTHGFGPVCSDVERVIDAVDDSVRSELPEEYAERIRAAFPKRDGNNRQRVFEAMIEAGIRRDISERSSECPPDRW